MVSSVTKKIMSYAVLFLNVHPELKRKVLNVVCRFPGLNAKLKRLKAETAHKEGASFWQTVVVDFGKWFIRKTAVQNFLTKVLSIVHRIEKKLQDFVALNPSKKITNVNTTEKEELNLSNLTPQARHIYYNLKKALAEK